ncbi:putative chloramphenicol acetyltransferase-like domain superfamily [Plasmopara halstedii]
MQNAINSLSEKCVIDVKIRTSFAFDPDLFLTFWLHSGMYDAKFDAAHPLYALIPRTCFGGLAMFAEF